MRQHLVLFIIAAVAVLPSALMRAQMKPWNNPGLGTVSPGPSSSAPAPLRDLSGIWDAGTGGIQPTGHVAAPFTPLGQKMADANKPGNGPRQVDVSEDNDPLSTLGDPTGFPRIVLYELRPFQIVQTPNQVLILYKFEKRWRVIWTDGRALPKDPDPRWYGYSVGRWEDDHTLVVETVGTDDRTWLDNAGNPHSNSLRVEERYRRANRGTMELTVTIDDPLVYTKPWTALDRLPIRLMPDGSDLMEMIPSASEAAAYKRAIAAKAKRPSGQ
jgi:hypothetical protein